MTDPKLLEAMRLMCDAIETPSGMACKQYMRDARAIIDGLATDDKPSPVEQPMTNQDYKLFGLVRQALWQGHQGFPARQFDTLNQFDAALAECKPNSSETPNSSQPKPSEGEDTGKSVALENPALGTIVDHWFGCLHERLDVRKLSVKVFAQTLNESYRTGFEAGKVEGAREPLAREERDPTPAAPAPLTPEQSRPTKATGLPTQDDTVAAIMDRYPWLPIGAPQALNLAYEAGVVRDRELALENLRAKVEPVIRRFKEEMKDHPWQVGEPLLRDFATRLLGADHVE